MANTIALVRHRVSFGSAAQSIGTSGFRQPARTCVMGKGGQPKSTDDTASPPECYSRALLCIWPCFADGTDSPDYASLRQYDTCRRMARFRSGKFVHCRLRRCRDCALRSGPRPGLLSHRLIACVVEAGLPVYIRSMTSGGLTRDDVSPRSDGVLQRQMKYASSLGHRARFGNCRDACHM